MVETRNEQRCKRGRSLYLFFNCTQHNVEKVVGIFDKLGKQFIRELGSLKIMQLTGKFMRILDCVVTRKQGTRNSGWIDELPPESELRSPSKTFSSQSDAGKECW